MAKTMCRDYGRVFPKLTLQTLVPKLVRCGWKPYLPAKINLIQIHFVQSLGATSTHRVNIKISRKAASFQTLASWFRSKHVKKLTSMKSPMKTGLISRRLVKTPLTNRNTIGQRKRSLKIKRKKR